MNENVCGCTYCTELARAEDVVLLDDDDEDGFVITRTVPTHFSLLGSEN